MTIEPLVKQLTNEINEVIEQTFTETWARQRQEIINAVAEQILLDHLNGRTVSLPERELMLWQIKQGLI